MGRGISPGIARSARKAAINNGPRHALSLKNTCNLHPFVKNVSFIREGNGERVHCCNLVKQKINDRKSSDMHLQF